MVPALGCVVVTLAAGIRAHCLALPDEAGRNDSVRWRVRPVKPLLRGVLGKMGRCRKAEPKFRVSGLFGFAVKDIRQTKQSRRSAGRAPF
jgi:hypothetical protein